MQADCFVNYILPAFDKMLDPEMQITQACFDKILESIIYLLMQQDICSDVLSAYDITSILIKLVENESQSS